MKIENRIFRFSIFLIVALKPFLYLFRFIAMNKLEDIIRYEQFDNLEFIASQIVAGFITGLHRSPYHGFSVEFAEHRGIDQTRRLEALCPDREVIRQTIRRRDEFTVVSGAGYFFLDVVSLSVGESL